jgi:hypothetical protein
MWNNIHPGDIAEAIRQVVLCLALFGVLEMTPEQQNGLDDIMTPSPSAAPPSIQP